MTNQTSSTTSSPPPQKTNKRVFDFAPSLASHVASAALVVSHAGSGSIFEALTARKALVVVPNPLLMDNHQAELGARLKAMGVLECAAPGELAAAVRRLDAGALRRYERGDAGGIVGALDALTGRRGREEQQRQQQEQEQKRKRGRR